METEGVLLMPLTLLTRCEFRMLGLPPGRRLRQAILDLYQVGEAVAVSLDREVRLRLSVQDQSQATSGVCACVHACVRVCMCACMHDARVRACMMHVCVHA